MLRLSGDDHVLVLRRRSAPTIACLALSVLLAWWLAGVSCSSSERPTADGTGQSGVDPGVYPAPVPLLHDVGTVAACPSDVDLMRATLDVSDALAWYQSFVSPDPRTREASADRAYWSMLGQPPAAPAPLTEDRIEIGAAAASPYAALLDNACGANVVQHSEWLRVCPGPCSVTSSQSLVGHFFLINRRSHWLVWASG